MFVRKEYTIEATNHYRFDQNWTTIKDDENSSIRELVKVLKRSPTGKKIIALAEKKALEQGESFWEVISPGEGSLTDTTLVRKFSPSNPDAIKYEMKSKVYLNRNLSVKNALLDMAHELTHFSLRESFNPYNPKFGLKDFITSTVEGRGGEVEAYLIECQVLFEVFPNDQRGSNCSRVVDENSGTVNKGKGVKEFYHLGRYFSVFTNSLKKHDLALTDFNASSKGRAHFISSAYGLPYPLAAIQEYEAIMSRVCQNDERRLSLMRQKVSREPASGQKLAYRSLASSFEKRCSAF